MKKILLFLIISNFSFAQLEVKKLDGTIINNGDIIGFNSVLESVAKMKFKIYNTSSNPINVRIRCNSLTNNDGSGMQLCLTDCYFGVAQGQMYPPEGPLLIPANSNVGGDGQYFWNSDTGSGTYPLDYSFRFFMVDGSGLQIGTPINFTYRYDPNLSTQTFDSLQNIGIQIENTLVSQELKVQAIQNTSVVLYDINGRALVQSNLKMGENIISVQNLNSGMYIASFITEEGKTATVKIMVK